MIYLDNNSTTPVLPEVLEEMLLDLDSIPRNPSAVTSYGREGRNLLVQARKTIADYLEILPQELTFTASGTEGNNTLVNGLYKRNPGNVITTKIEHSSLIKPIEALSCPVTYLEVDASGAPTPTQVANAITHDTSFIALSGANSITGVLIDIEEIAKIAEEKNIPLLIDGVALLGKHLFTPIPTGVTAMTFSAHKCHGPKGAGAFFLRKGVKISPYLYGGHQENGMRAGTENLPAILGFAKAISLLSQEKIEFVRSLRNSFEKKLLKTLPNCEVTGKGERNSATSNIYFKNYEGENLLIKLDESGIICSLGSACSSGTLEPSHVHFAMGFSKERAMASLRFSFSQLNTMDEVDQVIDFFNSDQ